MFPTAWNSDDKRPIVLPSKEWKNAKEFFTTVKPPFF